MIYRLEESGCYKTLLDTDLPLNRARSRLKMGVSRAPLLEALFGVLRPLRPLPAPELLPAIDDQTEKFSGLCCIVGCRVGFTAAEVQSGPFACLGEHRVSEGKAGKRRGIEMREGMKRISLDITAFICRVKEASIKMGVMTH